MIYYKRYIIFLLFFLSINLAFALNVPELDCVSQDGAEDTLTWNPVGPPCIPYIVYGSTTSTGPFIPVDTIFSSASRGIRRTRNGMVYYYLACLSSPGITTDTLDNYPPAIPEIEYVTVSNKNDVFISWERSASPETFAYFIYKNYGGNPVTVFDTVYGRNTTSYLHLATDTPPALPNNRSWTYYIAAVDSCWNRGSYSSNPHNTLFVSVNSIDSCDEKVTISWNEYKNWPLGVKGYRVLLSADGGVVDTLTVQGYDSLIYTYENVNDYDSLCFTIVASDSSGTYSSTSNEICFGVEVLIQPQYTKLTNVTVTGTNQQIDLEWYGDTLADIVGYAVKRKTEGGSFSIISPKPLSQNPVKFSDNVNLQPADLNYYYKIISLDICNKEYESNIVKTILLQGNTIELVNLLEWNKISMGTLPISVIGYEIYRKVNDGWSLNPIKFVGPNDKMEFSDSIASVISETGKYDYIIAANYKIDTGLTIYKSYSNILTLEQPFKIYIPNAFMPNGINPVNRVFMPNMTFIDIESYTFQVFNKWGEMVFETDVVNVGWDGTLNGKLLPAEVFVYNIEITETNGYTFFRRGTVMLIR